MTAAVQPIEVAAARRALTELRETLHVLAPELTWRPDAWMFETTKLQSQLGRLPWILRALRASPALDLTTCPPGGARWVPTTNCAIEHLQSGPLSTLTAVLIQMLDRTTPRHTFAALAARWPLTAGRLLDALDELLDLLQTRQEPT